MLLHTGETVQQGQVADRNRATEMQLQRNGLFIEILTLT